MASALLLALVCCRHHVAKTMEIRSHLSCGERDGLRRAGSPTRTVVAELPWEGKRIPPHCHRGILCCALRSTAPQAIAKASQVPAWDPPCFGEGLALNQMQALKCEGTEATEPGPRPHCTSQDSQAMSMAGCRVSQRERRSSSCHGRGAAPPALSLLCCPSLPSVGR